METPQLPSARKKFLLWSIGTLSTFTLLKIIKKEEKKPMINSKKNDTVKVLTQDGTLVEIDRKHLVTADINEKKITIDELKEWIKKQS
ncbi:MAG: hypothetical protein U0X91_26700 [Spirosomataceae bacterium]